MSLRRLLVPFLVAAATLAPMAAGLVGSTSADSGPKLAPAAPGHPSVFHWQGAALDSPVSESSISTTSLSTPCDGHLCEDTRITVPAQAGATTLYVKVQWQHPQWSLYTYVIEPDGKTVHGGGVGCDADSYDKGCGNQTTLPLDEVTIPSPKPGVWTVRVAAVHMHGEHYAGTVSLTNSPAVQYVRENLAQMTTHLTRDQRVNVVFVGWTPSAQELTDLRANLTNQFHPAVAEKQFSDCLNDLAGAVAGLVQGIQCDYTGTDKSLDQGQAAGSTVPYFEPLRFNVDTHFLAADDRYTRDLFATIQKATQQGQQYGVGRVPFTSETAPFKETYLAKYNAEYGQYRGAAHLVTDTTTVDMVDGFSVEDWIQSTRFDPAYRASFTDLTSHATTGAQFINPDPNATRDIHWNGNGTHAVDVDHDPQGANTGLTFFLLDTFSPQYADQYFRPDHYHVWSTFDHWKDPDTGAAAGPDNGRGWGGRYRFQILDLGAAPSEYERSDWVSANVNPEDGSAFFDPPIWQWRNDPQWNGTLPVRHTTLDAALNSTTLVAHVPYHYAGDTLGEVLGYELTTGLSFKYLGAYLYRPIPDDVYIINTLQVVDHYSLPYTQGGQDLYKVDLSKVYQPAVGLEALSSSAPYATFSPNFLKYITLGCASQRFVADQPGVGTMVADPTCTAPDGLQQAIEDGKAAGAASVASFRVPDYAVDQSYIRDYIDEHRDQYAPMVDGAFSVPVFNVMFEKQFNAALPLLVGGIAIANNGGEGWGQLDNINDDLVPSAAVDCAQSAPGACTTLQANPQHHDYYLTYVVTHEAAHFLGLNHPHDGAAVVQKAADGTWTKYTDTLKWLYDISASPTTYAGDYNQYEDVDQDRLMYGHTAEYMKEAQDWLSDAWFQDGAAGLTAPSASSLTRERASHQYRDLATRLFQAGDYLHAQYAMKDAMLYAQGDFEAQTAPHRLTLDESSHQQHAVFAIHPQAVYSPDAAVPVSSATVPGSPTAPAATAAAVLLPNTAGATPAGAAVAAFGALLSVPVVRRRRGRRPRR